MTVAISTSASQKGMLVINITGVASTDNAGIGYIANPEGVTLGITRAFLYFTTGSTGAANLDIGVTTIAAKGSDIVSAMDMVQATVGGKFMFGPAAQAAETESPTAKWTSATYMTFTGSGSSVGLAAKLYVEYIRLD